MPRRQAVLAVVFDFDDTLMPDSTSRLLASRGIDPAAFWADAVGARMERGYDPTPAYLTELLANTRPGLPLDGLSNADLAAFGATLDETFYQGIPGLFGDLQSEVRSHRDMSIEFYVISGGLKDLIDGSR